MKKLKLDEIDGILTVKFSGFIDSQDDIDQMNEIITSISRQTCENLYLDLSEVKYINSTVLGMLMKYYKMLPQTKITIFCSNPYILDLIKITCLDKFFIIKKSLDS